MPRPPLDRLASTPFDLFTFARPGPLNRFLTDRGILHPWWADPDCLISFFRPLSALTHDVDYALWPGSPVMAHVHGLLWYAALLAVVCRAYERFVAPRWLAALSFLLYAIDDTHAGNVAWIANRHSFVGTALGLSALLAHDRFRRDPRGKLGPLLGPACLALGLLSSEMAIGACAYLFSYAAFVDRGSRRSRALSLLPYAAVVLLWRAAYHRLGYGAAGSDVYVDPGRDPAAFLLRLPTMLAVLLQGQLGFLPSDDWPWIDHPILAGHAVAFVFLFAALLGLAAYPLLARERTARFWCASMLGAFVPASAGMPAERSLLFSGVAAMALAAHLFAMVSERLPCLPARKGWRALVVFVVGLLWVRRVIVAPLNLPVHSHDFEWLAATLEQADDAIPRVPDMGRRTLVIVNPPSVAFASYESLVRATRGEPVPLRVRWFGAASSDMTVTRTSERAVNVRLDGGFTRDLSDRLYSSERRPMAVGDEVELSGMTVTVTDLAANGGPAAAEFVFDEPLESPSYLWMRWDAQGCAPFSPPRVGETVRLAAVRP